MKSNRTSSLTHALVYCSSLLFVCVTSAAGKAQHGAVATVHPLATDAAVAALERGGNAIDAAVAAGLTLGVVDGENSGIGGGCFMLIRLAGGRFVAIDGRETAAAAATRAMFIRDGRVDPQLSLTGPLAVAVPGALAAYEQAVREYGRLPLRTHLSEAAKIAENGFVIDRSYAKRLEEVAGDLRKFEAARATFLDRDGQPRRAGDRLRQPDLARTYRAIAEHGTGWFYGGPFARVTADWMRQNGGLITREDLANYRVKLREPLKSTYRGYEIVGFPPPSSGGVHVAQILNILEGFDVQAMGVNSAGFVHLTAEAMKLAFADRAFWLGDPDFAKVPRGLVSKGYAAGLAREIRLDRATAVSGHGIPAGGQGDYFGGHTTHFSTADAEGNWVACTATINTTFGAKVVVPGTGVVLNNEMDDFSAEPGVTNYFGLLGAEANAVAPGKRPLSSMSPTIVLKDGQPILSVGAAGGPTIISQTLLVILDVLDFGMGIDAALAQPRFHHQWRPDELKIERRLSVRVRGELERRGHNVGLVDAIGVAQAVGANRSGAGLAAAHDPRAAGKATSW